MRLLCLFCVGCAAPGSWAGGTRGAVLTSWQADGYDDPAESLDTLESMGATHLAVLTTWYVDDAEDLTIEPILSRSPTEDGVARAVEQARARGLSVSLKPHVDRRDGGWRGFIRPGDPEAWMGSYRSFILHHASMAAELEVEQFVLGTELAGLSGEEDVWRSLVAEIRGVYDGELVYAANWDEYEDVAWWDAIDVVGVDAWFPLSRTQRPTTGRLRRTWRGLADTLGDFGDSVGMDVLLTEYGYQARVGTSRTPWWSEGEPDEEIQARCHEAAWEAIGTEPRIRGAMLWKVDPVEDLDDFDILGRQAEEVVADAWSRIPQ